MFDRKKLENLRHAMETWEQEKLKETIDRVPERREEFITTSSEPINRLYTPLDIEDIDFQRDLGLPGEYPYTRAVHPTLYRGRPWTMRMFAGFGSAEETNLNGLRHRRA